MTIALWIVNGLLGLLFIASGASKALTPKAKLYAKGMTFTEDFSDGSVKLIGIAEVLGGLGLILPMVTGIAPILAPIAATCLAVIMAGAIAVHARRKEAATPSIVLLIASLLSAILGFVVVL